MKCYICKKNKRKKQFHRQTNSKRGYQYYCKICAYENKKLRWNLRTEKQKTEYLKKQSLRLRYGITIEKFKNILKSQRHVCAICKKKETQKNQFTKGNSRKLSVDHCHKTGKVRGLLCSTCNRCLGLLNDDLRILKSAVKYLERHQSL